MVRSKIGLGLLVVAGFILSSGGLAQTAAQAALQARTPITKDNAASVKPLAELKGHTGPAFSVAFSPKSDLLVSGGSADDHTVRLWDVGSASSKAVLEGHTAQIAAVSFNADGTVIESASYDQSLRLWDAASGKPSQTISQNSDKMPLQVNNLYTFFSADGSTLVYTPDGEVNLLVFDVATQKERDFGSVSPDLSNAVGIPAVSADGKIVAVADTSGAIHVIDAVNEKETAKLAPSEASASITALTFSPDAKLLAAADTTASAIQIWNLETGQPLAQIAVSAPDPSNPPMINGLAFSPDGTLLVSTGSDMKVTLWDVAGGKSLAALDTGGSQPFPAAWSPDGTLIATGGVDGTVILWGVPGS